ncbi:MAG: hypothetical protein DRQ45_06885 [Gammaproteobacteria bacterium]|nr:MAG: hypothetical protein DRQ45_06885 [Gammaproteobacteria bacterium]
MTSPVSIFNIALGWLGESAITSFGDSSDSAQLGKNNYNDIRDTVLEEVSWTFAVKRIEPARIATKPLYGFSAAFQIPPEVLRVLTVSDASTSGGSADRYDTGQGGESKIPWNREGDKILTNTAERIYMRAIVRITDPNKYSPSFIQALAARIAADICIPLTQDEKVQTNMEALYQRKLAAAGTSDGRQGRSERTRSNSLTRVR